MKKIRVSSVLIMAFVATLCLSVTPAMAQDKPADSMEIVREKIKADKKLFVAANMQLTETEAKDFWPVYEGYQKDLEMLMQRTRRVIEDYAASFDTMTDERAIKLLDEYLWIQRDHPKLIESYRPKLGAALPEKKVVRYYQIENKIHALVNFELARKIPLVK